MHLRVAALPRYRVEVSTFHWLAALVVAEALVFTFFGSSNRDEGWYLYASRQVYEGKVPYRDFPYFQAPVLPYLYGLPQSLFGPSVLVGRLTSLVLVFATIAVLVRTARVVAGPPAVNWALGLLCLNPTLLYFGTLARSEAVTTLLCGAALLCFFAYRRGMPALLFAPAALLLASGVRVTILPAFAVVTAFVWWRTPATARERLLSAAVLAGGLALISLPALLSPQRALFDLWSSQVSRAHQWAPGHVDQLGALIGRFRDIQAIWYFFLVVLIPAAALLAYLTLRFGQGWRPRWRASDSDALTDYLMTFGFAGLLLLPYFGVSPFEPRYFIPSAACISVALAAAAVQLPVSRGLEDLRPLFARLLVIVFVAATPFYLAQSELFLRFRQPDLIQGRSVGKTVASYLSPGDHLMAFDTTLALEADRPLMPGLEMAQFSYWPRMTSDSAAGAGVMNKEQLRGAIRAGVPKVVAFTDLDLFIIALDTDGSAAAAASDEPALMLLPELADHYTLERTVSRYGQFRDKLYIYVRTTPETVTGTMH